MFNVNDDNPIGLRNNVISLIFLVAALFSMLFLFVVILIHSKYQKFRKGIYSIFFACIIYEYICSLIYFLHGLDYLTFKVLAKNDILCDIFSFLSIFLYSNLVIFNSLLIINLLLNRIPLVVKKKSKPYEIYIRDSLLNVKKFSFIRLHIACFILSISTAVLMYLTDNLGRSKLGECFVKENANGFAYIVVISIGIYTLLSVVYIFNSLFLKKQYSESFPMLKNYWIYLLSTSLGWGISTLSIETSEYDVINTLAIIGGIMIFLVIAFYRFSCGYIKNILKQESSNRFIAMIMILFCLDNKADPESYETRSNMILKTEIDYMKTDINENNIN